MAYDGGHATTAQITAYLYSMTCMETDMKTKANSPGDNVRIKEHLHSCVQCKALTRAILDNINSRYS